MALVCGVGVHNPDYVEAYIDYADACISEILIFEILLNENIADKRKMLDFLWYFINKGTDEAIEEYGQERRSAVKEFRNKYGIYRDDIDSFCEFFCCYMVRKSSFEESEKIFEVLVKELDDKPGLFDYANTDDSNGASWKKRILLGSNASDYKTKIYETFKIVKLARSMGNDWIKQDNLSDLRVAYRESFVSKSSYDQRQSMRIARNLLSNEKISWKQWNFYNLKMQRGYFAEWGIISWYKDYVKIMNKIRQQFLVAYNPMDDQCGYKVVFRVLYDFCDLVYYWEKGLERYDEIMVSKEH